MPTETRYHYLDAVRAFALLLGIVFHASLSFTPMFIGWAVMDVSTSSLVLPFITVSHSFRMELFFLISGFFSHRVLCQRGMGHFLQSRFLRIAVPFVVAWFILKPLLVSGWVMGFASLRGEVDVLAGLRGGFQSLQTLPAGLFVGTHLWFLYYLMLTTVVALILRTLFGRSERILSRADAVLRWGIKFRGSLLLVAVPTAVLIAQMQTWGMDTPDKSLVPHLPVGLVYSGFFLLGWMLNRQPELMERIATVSRWTLGATVASIVATLWLSTFQLQPSHPGFQLAHLAHAFSYAVMMWSLLCVTLGVFRRFVDRPHAIIRYLADASYWLYLIHLPVVVWLQVAMAELPLHWTAKWVLICTLMVAIGLLLYDLAVRPTFLGKLLNGRKRERILFAKTPAPLPQN